MSIKPLVSGQSTPVQTEVPQSSEQFLNASSDELPMTPPLNDNASPGPSTTVGKGETPPLVKDLKDALQKGVTVGNNSHLNPRSPEFSPSTSKAPFLLTNGPSSALSTNSTVPVMTKMQLPSLAIPGLNLSASEFVPSVPSETGFENGFESLSIESPPEQVQVEAILSGFEPVAPVKDLAMQPIMKSAAQMLVKGTLYVASFDTLKEKVLTTLCTFTPSKAVFDNLAEMFVYWVGILLYWICLLSYVLIALQGVIEPYLCYTSCKMCEFIFEDENSREFRSSLLVRCVVSVVV